MKLECWHVYMTFFCPVLSFHYKNKIFDHQNANVTVHSPWVEEQAAFKGVKQQGKDSSNQLVRRLCKQSNHSAVDWFRSQIYDTTNFNVRLIALPSAAFTSPWQDD